MDGAPSTEPNDHGMMAASSASTARLPPSLRSIAKTHHFDPNTSTDNAPPYWTRADNRTVSQASFDSLAGRGITMADNTTSTSETNAACWAKSVTIDEYSTINGSALNVGAFVVYHITIETLSGSHILLRKRYSDFDTLRHNLLMTFPLSEASMPVLPPKNIVAKFRPNFLQKRRMGLQYFLNCVLLNPEFASAPVMKEFLFG